MATVERIISGPTTDPDVSWLVVLYRSTAVAAGKQLIGYIGSISEDSYSRLTADELDYFVGDTWVGAIDEPPGSDLPNERLNPDGIAWWLGTTAWSAETGPADNGLPATRTYLLDPPPRMLRAMIFRVFEEEFWLDVPSHLREVEVLADFFGIEAEFILDEPAGDAIGAWVADLEGRTLGKLPAGLTASFRAAVLRPDGKTRGIDRTGDSRTAERRTIAIRTNW
jgi:hypothetical protein